MASGRLKHSCVGNGSRFRPSSSAIAATTVTVLMVRSRRWNTTLMTIQGAVIRRDQDTERQLPIADALVTATHGRSVVNTRSDAAGYYHIKFPEVIWPGQNVVLSFTHSGYLPLDMNCTSSSAP